ncbi:hypothetical protein C2E20_7539 isoform A [Micractinium conductrix]|uniref:Uncharacterized protein n=1 Tax=Micractinium conductrix TaxID=554055 RepID=A0A2P6V499_9CHLO|nr:hypothetical protein C2E20_7539 isoform A [Micractinium conductrix]|eukprot:PSC68905.1 hypothetical protein C2E20_7539 isoform A [Micractinium conductrix]
MAHHSAVLASYPLDEAASWAAAQAETARLLTENFGSRPLVWRCTSSTAEAAAGERSDALRCLAQGPLGAGGGAGGQLRFRMPVVSTPPWVSNQRTSPTPSGSAAAAAAAPAQGRHEGGAEEADKAVAMAAAAECAADIVDDRLRYYLPLLHEALVLRPAVQRLREELGEKLRLLEGGGSPVLDGERAAKIHSIGYVIDVGTPAQMARWAQALSQRSGDVTQRKVAEEMGDACGEQFGCRLLPRRTLCVIKAPVDLHQAFPALPQLLRQCPVAPRQPSSDRRQPAMGGSQPAACAELLAVLMTDGKLQGSALVHGLQGGDAGFALRLPLQLGALEESRAPLGTHAGCAWFLLKALACDGSVTHHKPREGNGQDFVELLMLTSKNPAVSHLVLELTNAVLARSGYPGGPAVLRQQVQYSAACTPYNMYNVSVSGRVKTFHMLKQLAADVTGDRVFVDSLPLPTRQLFAAYGALQQAAAAAPLVAAAAGPARPAPPAWLVVAHAAVPDRKVGALLGAWQARAILSGTVIRITPHGGQTFGVVLVGWPAAPAGAGAAPVRPFVSEGTAVRLLCMVNEANFIKTLASADVISAGHPLSTAGMEDLKGATLLPPSAPLVNFVSLEAVLQAQLRPRPEALTAIIAVQKEDKGGGPRSQPGQAAIDEAAGRDGRAAAALWAATAGELAAHGFPISLLNLHDSSQLQMMRAGIKKAADFSTSIGLSGKKTLGIGLMNASTVMLAGEPVITSKGKSWAMQLGLQRGAPGMKVQFTGVALCGWAGSFAGPPGHCYGPAWEKIRGVSALPTLSTSAVAATEVEEVFCDSVLISYSWKGQRVLVTIGRAALMLLPPCGAIAAAHTAAADQHHDDHHLAVAALIAAGVPAELDDGDEAAAAEEADQEEEEAAAEPAAAPLPAAAVAGVPESVPAELPPDEVAGVRQQLAAAAAAASSLVQEAGKGAQQAVQAAVMLRSPPGAAPALLPPVSPAAPPPGYMPLDRGSTAQPALQPLPPHLAAASGSAAAAAAATDSVCWMVAIGEAVQELDELLSTGAAGAAAPPVAPPVAPPTQADQAGALIDLENKTVFLPSGSMVVGASDMSLSEFRREATAIVAAAAAAAAAGGGVPIANEAPPSAGEARKACLSQWQINIRAGQAATTGSADEGATASGEAAPASPME